ncbi:MAG: nucleoside-diphosphate kinase, partial [archaeon]
MENEALILIKPDGVKRNIIGEVIGRFERTGLEIIGMKLTKPTEKQLKKHYPDSKTKSMGQKAEEKFKEEGKEFKWTPEEYGEIILKKMRESFKNSKIIA